MTDERRTPASDREGSRRGAGSGPDPASEASRVAFAEAFRKLRDGLGPILDIRSDANVEGTIEAIRKDMVFRGHNVWVLVCSIFIASIGLDTNSTAVVIGAMLISPLMGPILGVGLSVGVNDGPTLRRALRHFGVMTGVALLTSTLYFLITPLGEAQSELLARTRPTLLDAAIGMFGGLAGIVGVSRRDRGNVIPGVAIATALMPPLCTAGFGLANGAWQYFFGAIYLFALNSMFIAGATVFVVRYLRFPLVEYMDEGARARGRLQVAGFALVVLLPATWLMVGVVKESLFQRRARDFVAENFGDLAGVNIVNQRFTYSDTLSTIEIFLTGAALPPATIDRLETRMAAAGLERTALRVHEPQDLAGEISRLSGELRVGVVQDLYERQAQILSERDRRIQSLEAALGSFTADTIPISQIMREVAVQHPLVERISFGDVVSARCAESCEPGAVTVDTIPTALVGWRGRPTAAQRAAEMERLGDWLRVRLQVDTLQVIDG